MSKCEHGQKITIFCATQCCVWKQAGGCPTCMKKYHNHMGPTVFVKQEEAAALVKKFSVDPSVKPKCRTLQEVIFNYFNLIKNELTSFIDSSCMDMINQIGHPFLTENGLLTTFKRLKKKDYKKIQQKEFKQLYEASQKISEKQLLENEKRIYLEKLKINVELMNTLERSVRTLERTIKQVWGETINLNHDGVLNQKINQISTTIIQGKHERKKSSVTKEVEEKSFEEWKKSRQKAQNAENKELKQKENETKSEKQDNKEKNQKMLKKQPSNELLQLKLKAIEKQKELLRQKEKEKQKEKQKERQRERERQKEKQKEKQREKQKERQREIQRIKQKQKLEFEKIKQKSLRERENVRMQEEKQGKQKYSRERVQRLNSLDKEIVRSIKLQKKKSQKEEKIFKNKFDIGDQGKESPRKRMYENKEHQINEKKQKLIGMMKQKDDSTFFTLKPKEMDKDSDKYDSVDSIENREDKLHLFAHTVLPRTESRQKIFEETKELAPKTFIIPVDSKIEEKETKDIHSPLLKNKFKEREQSKSSSASPKTISLKISPKKIKSNEDQTDLTEKQEKSLALLIKSVNLKEEEAIPILQASLQYSEENLSAAQYLSYLYLQLNKPKDCLNICNKMLQKLPNSSETKEISWNLYNNKTAALNILGRYSESIVILEDCLKYKQTDKLYKNLGDAYYSIGMYQKAIYNYEKAVNERDNYDEAHYNLAVCLFMQENYYNAKFSIAKAVQLNQKNQAYTELQKEIGLRIKQF